MQTLKTVLFCVPLKKGTFNQYETFVREYLKKENEYKEMLTRYDIHSATVWHKNINDRDYVFVYHKVGSKFREKMKGWDNSNHPFDQWFRQNMMAVYDIENAAGMEEPHQLYELEV